MKYSPYLEEEGIYAFRNANSSYYLNMNHSTFKVTQGTFNDINSLWTVSYSTDDNKYTIQSANGRERGLSSGSKSGSTYEAMGINTIFSPDITVFLNKDGSYSFVKTIDGVKYALSVSTNSTSNNAEVLWSRFYSSAVGASQKWFMDTAAYRLGDVDMNGIIDKSDADIVLKIASELGASGSTTYKNANRFLADYDRNGRVNAVDASAIMRNYT